MFDVGSNVSCGFSIGIGIGIGNVYRQKSWSICRSECRARRVQRTTRRVLAAEPSYIISLVSLSCQLPVDVSSGASHALGSSDADRLGRSAAMLLLHYRGHSLPKSPMPHTHTSRAVASMREPDGRQVFLPSQLDPARPARSRHCIGDRRYQTSADGNRAEMRDSRCMYVLLSCMSHYLIPSVRIRRKVVTVRWRWNAKTKVRAEFGALALAVLHCQRSRDGNRSRSLDWSTAVLPDCSLPVYGQYVVSRTRKA